MSFLKERGQLRINFVFFHFGERVGEAPSPIWYVDDVDVIWDGVWGGAWGRVWHVRPAQELLLQLHLDPAYPFQPE